MPLKVAILGGGMGGLAAAWELAHQPNGDAYDITVYQRGWRLGGKGASGRNLALGNRIEEHGLHILAGFYDTVLGILKSCYEELAPLPPSACGKVIAWEDALTGCDEVGIAAPRPDNQWEFWRIAAPPNAQAPGESAPPFTVPQLIEAGVAVLGKLRAALENTQGRPFDVACLPQDPFDLDKWRDSLASGTEHLLANALAAFLALAWPCVQPLADSSSDARLLWAGVCFVAGNLIGILRDGVVRPPYDFAALDEQDYKGWLRGHLGDIGRPDLSWDSPLVHAFYDLAFSMGTTVGAGTLLRVALLLPLGYRGHLYYKMNGGMGDIVFAPLYLALCNRNVKFRFFRRVQQLHVTDGTVTSICGEQQVPLDSYAPLLPLDGSPCWPNQPHWPDGASWSSDTAAYDFEDDDGPSPCGQPFTLNRGDDFDVVILAIPVGALSGICGELIAADDAFARMVSGVQTIPVQAVQLWLTKDASQLGWPTLGAVAAYALPFSSSADMSQVLPAETWPANGPRSVAYLCGAFASAPHDPSQAAEAVKSNALQWLQTQAPRLWPGLSAEGGFDWSVLFDQQAGTGRDRLDHQYFHAAVSPSDRYVLAVKGSSQYRLPPGASGFRNLALAGDWVQTQLNAGCVEAAAMAGIGAARAIIAGGVKP